MENIALVTEKIYLNAFDHMHNILLGVIKKEITEQNRTVEGCAKSQ